MNRYPLHRSLVGVFLIAGIPRMVALMVWTITFALAVGGHQYWFLAIGVLIHVILVMVSKREPFFFEIFKSAIRTPDRFEP